MTEPQGQPSPQQQRDKLLAHFPFSQSDRPNYALQSLKGRPNQQVASGQDVKCKHQHRQETSQLFSSFHEYGLVPAKDGGRRSKNDFASPWRHRVRGLAAVMLVGAFWVVIFHWHTHRSFSVPSPFGLDAPLLRTNPTHGSKVRGSEAVLSRSSNMNLPPGATSTVDSPRRTIWHPVTPILANQTAIPVRSTTTRHSMTAKVQMTALQQRIEWTRDGPQEQFWNSSSYQESTTPWTNVTTLGYWKQVFVSGYRNQIMGLIALCM